MLNQDILLFINYSKALRELDLAVSTNTEAIEFYSKDVHQTEIAWKELSGEEGILGEYNAIDNVIYISTIFQESLNQRQYDLDLIAEIKHHIVQAYLDKELQLEHNMQCDGSFAFISAITWLNNNRPVGVREISINPIYTSLYNFYLDDIFTKYFNITDFHTWREIVEFIENKVYEINRQMLKLQCEFESKSNEGEVYFFNFNYKDLQVTEVRVKRLEVTTDYGPVTCFEIIVDIAMYFEYNNIKKEVLRLIS